MRISASFRLFFVSLSALLVASPANADDGQRLLSIDHYVLTKSAVPAIKGQPAQIYVRERARAATVTRGSGGGNSVVLFVHGAGTPAEVAFDVPYQDYSWMAYLARAGFDVFSMDTTGYGRSTRPAPMNDPCNLAPEQQTGFVPGTPLHAQLSLSADHARFGLERCRRGGGLSALASPCGPRQPGRLVARRSALRRLCRAASRQGREDGAAGARLQPQRAGQSAPTSCARALR